MRKIYKTPAEQSQLLGLGQWLWGLQGRGEGAAKVKLLEFADSLDVDCEGKKKKFH